MFAQHGNRDKATERGLVYDEILRLTFTGLSGKRIAPSYCQIKSEQYDSTTRLTYRVWP